MDQKPQFSGFGLGQAGGVNPWTQGNSAQGSYANVGFAAPQQGGFGQAVPQQSGYNQAMSGQGGYGRAVPQPGVFGQSAPQPGPFSQAVPQQGVFGQTVPQQGAFSQAVPQQGAFGQTVPQQSGFSQAVPQQGAFSQAMPQQGAAQPGAGMWQTGGVPQESKNAAGQPAGTGAWPAQGTGWQQNGGQPWPEPIYNGQMKRRRRVRIDMRTVMTILVCAVIPLLLILAMLNHAAWSTILVSAAAVAMLTVLWLSQTFERPTNIMLTVLVAAALVVTIFLTVSPPGGGKNASETSAAGGNTGRQNDAGTAVTPTPDPSGGGQTEEEMGKLALQEEERATETDASVEVVDRFFSYWQQNLLDSMVNLCSRSWSQSLSSSTTPSQALFVIQANRIMISYDFVSITGSINDQRRTATYYADMYPPGRTTAARYILKVDVVQEEGRWYVDPRSIESNAPTATPTPASSLPTQPPSPPPADMSTVLYYNPDGGKLYHLDPYCQSARPEYLPFKGQFTYAEINDKKYKNLTPCTMCGAPVRYN